MSRQRETQTTQGNGQLVKGLRRRPLTAKTRVRFPYWLLTNSGKQMIRISVLVIFFARSNGMGQSDAGISSDESVPDESMEG